MEIHIHLHHHYDDKLFTEIKSINTKLQTMRRKNDEILAFVAEIKDAHANLAADLDRIATNVEGGLTAAEADGVATELRGLRDAAKQLSERNPEPGTGEPGTGEPGTGENGGDPNANL